MCKDYATALPLLEKSISLMEAAGPAQDPSYCWIKHDIGSIYLEQKKVDAAERAFAAALRFSETHTVSHIGYARVKLAKGELQVARRHYDRARYLNPTLVHWTTFESFKEAVQPATWFDTLKNLPRAMANMLIGNIGSSPSTGATGTTNAPVRQVTQTPRPSANQSNWQSSNGQTNGSYTAAGASSSRQASSTNTPSRPSSAVTRTSSSHSSIRPSTSATSTSGGLRCRETSDGWVLVEIEASRQSKRTSGSHRTGTSNYSSGATGNRGTGNGNGGDGGGSGSDDEDESSNDKWKQMRKESREILKYGGKEYVLSRDEKYYYSRDKAGHGTAYLKVYANKKNRLDFLGSLDRNMKFMEGKHESREGTSIRKSEMDVVRRR